MMLMTTMMVTMVQDMPAELPRYSFPFIFPHYIQSVYLLYVPGIVDLVLFSLLSAFFAGGDGKVFLHLLYILAILVSVLQTPTVGCCPQMNFRVALQHEFYSLYDVTSIRDTCD